MSGLSVATIKAPEFININSISPLVSECEIKVLYLGQNRNRSFISKEVAEQMAQTLPGVPIVGAYSANREDFTDHGEQIVIDGEGMKFNCLTKPYGFVRPDTKVWFQEFEDTNEMGQKTIRNYLMCQGYLWTQQYEEAKRIIEEGRPHSMELDEKSLEGHWTEDIKSGLEFFIINDAIFSKLCILGEDVEPCFEGSSITTPEVSSTFTFNQEDFQATLFSMIKELKELTVSLQDKGGKSMNDQNNEALTPQDSFVNAEENNSNTVVPQEPAPASTLEETEIQTNVPTADETNENENSENTEDNSIQNESAEIQSTIEENNDNINIDMGNNDAEDGEDKFTVLEQQLSELNEKYSLLEKENIELRNFKNEIENKQKDELIASFYMLSDEDKANVIQNKANYSLDEIEKELSVICVRRKVSFNNDSEGQSQPATIYNLNEMESDASLPAWLKAVEDRKNRK